MSSTHPQPGILMPPPPAARYLEFALRPGATRQQAAACLETLRGDVDGAATVLGLGLSAMDLLGAVVPGLRAFPNLVGAGADVPSTPHAIWLWLRGEDRGELLHRGRRFELALAAAFELADCADAFVHDGGRDLTGYEDGTENPQSGDATRVAIVSDTEVAPAGSSFAAVQRWVHDFERFDALGKEKQDLAIGRERIGNDEIDDAPASAHVQRTAQETFEPQAFVLRRSMPWAGGREAGLAFVAFGATLDPFEQLLRRMVGLEDGIVDALFEFTRPVTGAYYWCPPMIDGRPAIPSTG